MPERQATDHHLHGCVSEQEKSRSPHQYWVSARSLAQSPGQALRVIDIRQRDGQSSIAGRAPLVWTRRPRFRRSRACAAAAALVLPAAPWCRRLVPRVGGMDPQEIDMAELKLLNRRDRAFAAIAALVASLSVVSATVLAFLADDQTEWFAADSQLALAAHRCDRATDSTQRHACLHEVAEAYRSTRDAPTRMARR